VLAVPQERLDEARRLFEKFGTATAVADVFGVHPTTAARWLRRAGVSPNDHDYAVRRARADETRGRILGFYREGYSGADAAMMAGVSIPYARTVIREAGESRGCRRLDYDRILDLHAAHGSCVRVAEIVGCSPSSVSLIVKRAEWGAL